MYDACSRLYGMLSSLLRENLKIVASLLVGTGVGQRDSIRRELQFTILTPRAKLMRVLLRNLKPVTSLVNGPHQVDAPRCFLTLRRLGSGTGAEQIHMRREAHVPASSRGLLGRVIHMGVYMCDQNERGAL